MKLVSIETIPGQEFEALDIVRGTVVYSKNFGRDFMAGMKTLVGGEIESYTQMLTDRYASYDAGEGKAFEEGRLTLEQAAEYARTHEPTPHSGKQELYEAIVNMYI